MGPALGLFQPGGSDRPFFKGLSHFADLIGSQEPGHLSWPQPIYFLTVIFSARNGAIGALLGLTAFTLSLVTSICPHQALLKHATQRDRCTCGQGTRCHSAL